MITVEEFADQYRTTYYPSGMEAIEFYQQYQEYRSFNPDTDRSTAGNALDMPPGRIRAWDNGSKPDPVRGLEFAQERGWFDPDLETMRGLSVLVAWVFSAGSINEKHRSVMFTVGDESEEQRLREAADTVGIELRISREGGEGRAREYSPSEGGTIMGRFLAALGAPIGSKAEVVGLRPPDWLDEVPQPVVRDWVLTYLLNRGQWRETGVITLREERSTQYLDALAGLFEKVIGEPVRRNDKNIVLSVPAREVVDTWSGPLDEYEEVLYRGGDNDESENS